MKRPAAAIVKNAPSPATIGKRAKISSDPVEEEDAISVDNVVTPARKRGQDASAKRKADNSTSSKRREEAAAKQAEAAAKQKAEAAAAAQRREEERKAELVRIAAQRERDLQLAGAMAEKAIEEARKQSAEGAIEARKLAEDEDLASKASESAEAESKEADEKAAGALRKAQEAEVAAKKLAEEAAEARKRAEELEVAAAAARQRADADDGIAKEQVALAVSAKSTRDDHTLKLKTHQSERREAESRRSAANSKMVSRLTDFCRKLNLQPSSNDDLIDALERHLVSVPGTEAFKRNADEERAKKEAEEAALIAKREAEQELARKKAAEEEAEEKSRKEAEEAALIAKRKIEEDLARKHLTEQEERLRKQAEEAEVAAKKRIEEAAAARQAEEASKKQIEQAMIQKQAEEAAKREAERKELHQERVVIQKQSEVDDVGKRKTDDRAKSETLDSNKVASDSNVMLAQYELTNSLGAPMRSGTAADLSSGKAKYEGRLKHGARMERVDANLYKSEFGIEHALVKLIGEQSGAHSTPVFVNMRDIVLISAAEDLSEKVSKDEGKLLAQIPAEAKTDDVKVIAAPESSNSKEKVYELTNPLGASIRSGTAKDLEIGFSKYEGRLKGGTLLERLDESTYKSEFGIEHVLVRVIGEPFRPPVFVGIKDVSISTRKEEVAHKPIEAQSSDASARRQDKDDSSTNPFQNGMCQIILPGKGSPSQPTPEKQIAAPRKEQEVSPVSQTSSSVERTTPEAADDRASFAAGALSRQSELVRLLANQREALEKKMLEANATKSEHAAVLARNSAADEAAKPEVARLDIGLASATKAQSSCTAEVLRIKTLHKNLTELLKSPSKKSEKDTTSMKPQLKLLGIDKKTLDALPVAIGKKKRSQADNKLIAAVEDVFGAKSRCQAKLLEEASAEVKRREQELANLSEAKQRRANETSGLEAAMKAKEDERKACEEEGNNLSSELADLESRMSRDGLLRFSSSTQSCTICCTEVETGTAAMLGCNHGFYCFECITRFVETRLDNGTAGDVPCPQCSAPISEKDLVTLLPKKTVIRLHARSMEQEAVASGALQRSCPTPNCRMRHTLKEGSSGRLTCVMCAKESCLLCGTQPFHEGRTCAQHAARQRAKGMSKEDESFFKWMEATGTRQCPKCQMATSKENLARQTEQRSECHKMLCRNCGTRFCFKCLAILTDSYTCGCTKNKHGFIDPFSGEVVGHLKRGGAKKAAGSK